MSSLVASFPRVLAVVLLVVCPKLVAAQAPCDFVRCGWGATCVVEDERPVCKCNEICITLYDPVCGSDAKTYGNECELERAACQKKASITVASKGECASSGTKKPCPTFCPAIYKPVCGSDHKQYGNECEMNVAACQSGKKITKVNEGGCETFAVPVPAGPSCEAQILCTTDYKPVCSSDNVTYENNCVLQNSICRSGGRIRKAYDGECETFAPTPGPLGCKRCPRGPYLPVCGSNNVTYTNKCELERAACIEQRDISIKFERPCGKIKVCPTKTTTDE